MPDSARVEREKARLTEVRGLLVAAVADSEALYVERDELLRQLKAEGVPRSELLELSGLGSSAMKWVLSGGRQARTAAKVAAAKPAKKRKARPRAKAKK